MSSRPITDAPVREVADALRMQYALDEDGLRALGAKLAGADHASRHADNVAFAERFTAGHADTFDRLGQ